MKHAIILPIAFVLFVAFLFPAPLQKVKPNAVITTNAYTAYINTDIQMPVYVKYTLFHGGGSCKRSNRWLNDSKYDLVHDVAYYKSGYEKGHLANAEDFAHNCKLMDMTFMDYNRLPQTKELNRGIWKESEYKIREKSQTDSLLVMCGGYWDDSNRPMIKGMTVPLKCWKVVYDISTNSLLSCQVFTNTSTPEAYDITVAKLEKMLGYKLYIPTKKKKQTKITK